MPRTVLLIGGGAWLLAGIGCAGIALFGASALLARLPPLAIDADALGGAFMALAVGLLGLALAHVLVARGLAAGRRPARGLAVLLCGVMTAGLVAVAAAAAASAGRQEAQAVPLLSAAALAGLAALCYAAAAVRLVGQGTSESAA